MLRILKFSSLSLSHYSFPPTSTKTHNFLQLLISIFKVPRLYRTSFRTIQRFTFHQLRPSALYYNLNLCKACLNGKKYISRRTYSCHSLDAASIHGFPLRYNLIGISAGYILGQSEFPPADKDWRAGFLRWTQIRRRVGDRYFETGARSNFRISSRARRLPVFDESGKFEWPSLFAPSTFTFTYAPEHCRGGIQSKPVAVSFRADQPNLRCIWRRMGAYGNHRRRHWVDRKHKLENRFVSNKYFLSFSYWI